MSYPDRVELAASTLAALICAAGCTANASEITSGGPSSELERRAQSEPTLAVTPGIAYVAFNELTPPQPPQKQPPGVRLEIGASFSLDNGQNWERFALPTTSQCDNTALGRPDCVFGVFFDPWFASSQNQVLLTAVGAVEDQDGQVFGGALVYTRRIAAGTHAFAPWNVAAYAESIPDLGAIDKPSVDHLNGVVLATYRTLVDNQGLVPLLSESSTIRQSALHDA